MQSLNLKTMLKRAIKLIVIKGMHYLKHLWFKKDNTFFNNKRLCKTFVVAD